MTPPNLIVEKLQAIAENEQKVYDSGFDEGYDSGKGDFGTIATEIGTEVILENVNEITHDISVTLTSDTATDFEGVNLTARGKNLATINQIAKLSWHYSEVEFDGRQCVKTRDAGSKSDFVIEGGFKENTQYTISLEFYGIEEKTNSYTPLTITYTDNTKTYSGVTSIKGEWVKTTRVSTTGKTIKSINISNYGGVYFYVDINSFMLYEGAISDPIYEPYVEPATYQANANGEVEGVESIAPTMVLLTDAEDTTINAEYYLDGEKAIEQYKNLILDLGGEI